MRLSSAERAAIVETAARSFGEGTRVWLFGSRTDDNARGGDIDLYVETAEKTDILSAELAFRRGLLYRLGDRRIDVVIRKETDTLLPIHRIARETGVPL